MNHTSMGLAGRQALKLAEQARNQGRHCLAALAECVAEADKHLPPEYGMSAMIALREYDTLTMKESIDALGD